jgi:8-oxo-dGTP pyrophosphatase MutT (NUDIX family)
MALVVAKLKALISRLRYPRPPTDFSLQALMMQDAAPHAGPRILDAASIVLIDGVGTGARILMGLRQPDNIFLPNQWVFPGGRVEASDRAVVCQDRLAPDDEVALMHGLAADTEASWATTVALAAIRELFEETGVALGLAAAGDDMLGDVWPEFRARRLRPHLAPLTMIARAITPPGRPRRYDTRFFIANRNDTHGDPGQGDGEFADLRWFTLGEARELDLPTITRIILGDVEARLMNPYEAARSGVPFYYEQDGLFRRDLIRPDGS